MRFRLKLKTIRIFTFWLILLVLGGGIGYYFGSQRLKVEASKDLPKVVVNTDVPSEYSTVDFSLFWEVWKKLESDYLDPDKLDEDDMVYGAIQGMVSAVGDPYTVFLPPADQKRTEEDLGGAFEGVGIQLDYINSQLGVVAPMKGMPAEAAGVEAGDLILHIKDENKNVDTDTQGMSLPEAVAIIRGEHGMPITLTLWRETGPREPFDVTLKRDTIVIPSVDLEFVENSSGKKFAHLTLHRFGGRTEEEWNEAVDKILAEDDVNGVVLDMRNNPGGYLDGAIFIASEFIDSGVVVKQQGKYQTESFSVNRRGRLTNMPVEVLINRGSASASEIVAGALRDRLGAKLVGEKSFGKGTVQNAETMRNGTGIHITVARWLLPAGDWIHDTGLEPDVEASSSAETVDVDDVLQEALEAF